MIRNAIGFVLLAAVALTIWRIWGSGGSIGDFFNMIYGVVYGIIDGISKVLVLAWDTIVVHKAAS